MQGVAPPRWGSGRQLAMHRCLHDLGRNPDEAERSELGGEGDSDLARWCPHQVSNLEPWD